MSEKIVMTRQRQTILDELRKVKTHPTADELYEIVRRRLPHISLGTVYRNLEILAASGLIQRVHVSGTSKRYDGNPQDHSHIRCSSCGMVDDLTTGEINIEEIAADPLGYEVTGYRIEFAGICPACRKSGRETSRTGENACQTEED